MNNKNIYIIDNKPRSLDTFIRKTINYFASNEKIVNLHLITILEDETEKRGAEQIEKMINENREEYIKEGLIDIFEYCSFEYKDGIIPINGDPYNDENQIVEEIKSKVKPGGSLLVDMLLFEKENTDAKRIAKKQKILSHLLYEDSDLKGKCRIYTNYSMENTFASQWSKMINLKEKIYFRSDFELSSFSHEIADEAYKLATLEA